MSAWIATASPPAASTSLTVRSADAASFLKLTTTLACSRAQPDGEPLSHAP